jgi:hypothetical protein
MVTTLARLIRHSRASFRRRVRSPSVDALSAHSPPPVSVSLRWSDHLRIRTLRALRHEYWPTSVFYVPVVLYAGWLALRYGGLLTPGACNPGIENAGGWVGESKSRIMRALGPSPHVLTTLLVPRAGAAHERASAARAMLREHGLSLPVIMKPDAGQRGFAVRLVRTDADIERYLREVTSDVVMQPYHPGPKECGIFWCRHTPRTRARAAASASGASGFIFSITAKEFPILRGDGVRTLGRLILDHPRYSLQHRVFFARLREQLGRVPAQAEELRLSMSGNHCQGTMFMDGAHLMTPELARVVDELCGRFPNPDGTPGGLDIGRLDVRYTSDEALRAGKGLAIVELNGLSSESTNIYDPAWSLSRSYRTLFAQYRMMYELGAIRRAAGGSTITLRELRAMIREHFQSRTGSEIAD